MTQASLIDIRIGKNFEQVAGNQISVKTSSTVRLSLNAQDMKSYYKSGNNLVIELKSGKRTVLESFFVATPDDARNELVLENQGHYWRASYGESETSLSLEKMFGIDDLLASTAGDSTYMWLVGAFGLGGVAASANSGGAVEAARPRNCRTAHLKSLQLLCEVNAVS